MEFRFPVNEIFRQPIVRVGNNLVPPGFTGDRRAFWDVVAKVSEVVNAMGESSAAAQGLTKPITTAERLRNSEHTLYFLIDQNAANGRGAVTGMLKTGKKGLYVFDRNGQHYQVSPPCVLDFYIHESRQRTGLGKRLFEHMLKEENVEPVKMAIDRPSEKFMGFLNKHYSLNEPVRQMNNYVVFEGFFPNSPEKNGAVDVDHSIITPGKKQSANGLQTTHFAAPIGRYGAPRPPCSMGQIIHNQTSAIPNSTEPTGFVNARSVPQIGHHNASRDSPGYPNVTQSAPNVYYRPNVKLDGLAQNNMATTYQQQNSMWQNNEMTSNYQNNYANANQGPISYNQQNVNANQSTMQSVQPQQQQYQGTPAENHGQYVQQQQQLHTSTPEAQNTNGQNYGQYLTQQNQQSALQNMQNVNTLEQQNINYQQSLQNAHIQPIQQYGQYVPQQIQSQEIVPGVQPMNQQTVAEVPNQNQVYSYMPQGNMTQDVNQPHQMVSNNNQSYPQEIKQNMNQQANFTNLPQFDSQIATQNAVNSNQVVANTYPPQQQSFADISQLPQQQNAVNSSQVVSNAYAPQQQSFAHINQSPQHNQYQQQIITEQKTIPPTHSGDGQYTSNPNAQQPEYNMLAWQNHQQVPATQMPQMIPMANQMSVPNVNQMPQVTPTINQASTPNVNQMSRMSPVTNQASAPSVTQIPQMLLNQPSVTNSYQITNETSMPNMNQMQQMNPVTNQMSMPNVNALKLQNQTQSESQVPRHVAFNPNTNFAQNFDQTQQSMSQANVNKLQNAGEPSYDNQNLTQHASQSVLRKNTSQFAEKSGNQMNHVQVNNAGDAGAVNELSFGYPPQVPESKKQAISANMVSVSGR